MLSLATGTAPEEQPLAYVEVDGVPILSRIVQPRLT